MEKEIKDKRGGKRPGAGRKSKAELLGFSGVIDERLPAEKWNKIVDNLYKLAIGNNPKAAVSAASLLIAYRFGKPTEKHEHGGKDGGPITVKVVYE